MALNKYRKKPIIVEAVQWTGKNIEEMKEFAGDKFSLNYGTELDVDEPPLLYIWTEEGTFHASINDYIIKGIQGEFYPCKPDIFEQTYEPVHLTKIVKDEPGAYMVEDDIYGSVISDEMINRFRDRFEQTRGSRLDKFYIRELLAYTING